MDDPVLVDGFPARITPADFRRYHLQSFPKLAGAGREELIQQVVDSVYDVFTGVETIWRRQPLQVWYDKTRTCYRLLAAWFIADMYPAFVAGTATMGGLPLKRKKIDGVDLTFQDQSKTSDGYQNLLKGLDSNPFGKMAKIMITTSAARFRTRSKTRV
jgi:hypothetical protein